MKKILSFIFALCFMLGLTACGTQYEDTNGDTDFTLQTITEQNIVNLDVGSSGLSFTEESVGEYLHSSEYSAKSFNGVYQLYQTNFLLPSDIRVYIGHMNVEKGNFRLVVINDDEIIYDIPLDSFNETFSFENLSGSFSVNVAGESAAFEFYIDIQ